MLIHLLLIPLPAANAEPILRYATLGLFLHVCFRRSAEPQGETVEEAALSVVVDDAKTTTKKFISPSHIFSQGLSETL